MYGRKMRRTGRRGSRRGRACVDLAEATLASLREGQQARIVEVLGGAQLKARLENLGLREGKQVVKAGAMPAGGPVTVECDGFRVALGRGIAQRVKVETLGEGHSADIAEDTGDARGRHGD